MKKIILLLLIVSGSIIAPSQDLTQDTIFFKSGYNKSCLIVGDSQDHIYAKFISMDLNPGDTVTMPFKKDAIRETSNSKYTGEYFEEYLKQKKVLDAVSKGSKAIESNDNIYLRNLRSVSVATFDQRDMIVDGSQKECLLGYSYAAVGIAYPVNTKPKEKVSNLCSEIACNILNDKGILTEKLETSASDNKNILIQQLTSKDTKGFILITMQNLRSDCRGSGFSVSTLCSYTIKLDVYNKKQELVLHKEITGMEPFVHGTKYKKHIRNNTSKLLKAQLTRLLNEAGIINTL